MTEHSFHTPEPVELVLKVPAGAVVVDTVDGDESTVVVEGPDRLVENVAVEFEDNRILVELRGKIGLGITLSIGDFSIGSSRLTVRVRVPHGSRPDVHTASADMKLRGRFAALQTKSASGDLRVEGDIEGDATVKTVSGDIRLPGVGGSLTAQSVSGDVNVASVGRDAAAKSVSGDVRIDSARMGEVVVQSVSGDLTLGVVPGTNLDVDAGSVSGDLSSEVALGSDAGAVGDGPTLVVRGKTVSGNFRVFRAA
jgi:Putative adhesin